MGTNTTDGDLLSQRSLEGGIAYTLDKLVEMFSWLEVLRTGPMPPPETVAGPAFTHDFLQVALFRRAP